MEQATVTIGEYFTALWDRRDSAIIPQTRFVQYRDGSAPVPSQCHANVDRWVNENSGFHAVRGWLILSYGFERHSVVQDALGGLIDITLAETYPFLPHHGSQEIFDELGRAGYNQIFWPPISNEPP